MAHLDTNFIFDIEAAIAAGLGITFVAIIVYLIIATWLDDDTIFEDED